MRWQINKRVTWRCWLSSVWTGKSETSRSDPSPQTSTASSVDSQQSPATHQVHHTKLSRIHNHKSPFRATLAYRVALISISVTNIQTPAYAAIPRTWGWCIAVCACLCPSCHRYQLILLEAGQHGCRQLAQSHYAATPWPGIELTTSQPQQRTAHSVSLGHKSGAVQVVPPCHNRHQMMTTCQSNSSMHHYECIALCKDISLQCRQVIMNVLHHDNMVSANSSTVMATTETLQPALQFRHQDPTKSVIHLLKLVLVSQWNRLRFHCTNGSRETAFPW